MTISLAFLAPDLVNAAIDGRLPHGMGVTRLTDLPAEWSRQHQMLDLSLCEPRSPLPGVLWSSTRKNLGGPRCWICGGPFALAVVRKILVCASMNAARSGVSSFGVIALFLKE